MSVWQGRKSVRQGWQSPDSKPGVADGKAQRRLSVPHRTPRPAVTSLVLSSVQTPHRENLEPLEDQGPRNYPALSVLGRTSDGPFWLGTFGGTSWDPRRVLRAQRRTPRPRAAIGVALVASGSVSQASRAPLSLTRSGVWPGEHDTGRGQGH